MLFYLSGGWETGNLFGVALNTTVLNDINVNDVYAENLAIYS